ncbi:MAG: MFS transporter [Anaerolineae bacterium]
MSTLTPRRVVHPLGLAACLSLFGDLTLFAVLASQMQVVGLTLGAVGVMLGVHRLIRIPGNAIAGQLYDRWGRRPLFLAGMVLALLSTTGYGLVRGFWPFLVTRLAWGVAWMLINVGGLAMVVDVSTRADRGRWMGVYNTWLVAGMALGPLVGGLLADTVGFRLSLLACGGITAVGLAVAAVALPETDPARRGGRRNAPPTVQEPVRPRRRRTLGEGWRLRRENAGLARASALYLIVQFTGEGIVFSTVNLLLQERFGEQVTVGTFVLGLGSAAGLILGVRSLLVGTAGPLAGHVSDRRGVRTQVIVAGLAAGLAGFGLLAFANSIWLALLGVGLGAAGSGAVLATLAALVGDLTPPGRQGTVMGLYAAAGDVGSTAGPFLAFALAPIADLRWIYLACCLAFAAGLALIWPVRRSGAV